MIHLASILLGLTPLVPSVHAAQIPKASYKLELEPYDIQMVDFVFPSGLRIIFQAEHTQPVVAVTTVFDRGSESDPVGMEGIAHVVEHMAFKAKHGDLPKNWDVLTELGASLNASTSQDWTDYMTVAPKEALIPLLRIEAMRMVDGVAGVEGGELEREREVVRNELRMRYENAAIGAAWDSLAQLMYPEGHPYHRSTIGTHESLDNIDIQAVRDFVSNNYRPENTTIVVVGDFDIKQSSDIINQVFGDLPQLLVDPANPDAELKLVDPKPRVDCANRAEPPPPVARGPVHIKGPVDKETVVISWSLPGGYCGDEPLLAMAANYLSSYIYLQLVPSWEWDKEDATITGLGCFSGPDEYSSTITCYIEPKAGLKGDRLVEKAADALYMQWDREQLANPILRRFADRNYNVAKMSAMASTFQSIDETGTLWGRATETAHHVHFTGRPTYFSDSFEAYSKLEPFQVQELARKYVTRDRMVAVVVEPMDANERARREASARVGAGDQKQWEGATSELFYSTVFDSSDFTPENIRRATVVPDTERMRAFTLDNGMRVALMPHGDAPVVRAGLVVRGTSQTSDPWGLDRLAEALHYRGANQEERILAVAGFYSEGSLGSVAYGMTAEGSSGNIEAVLNKLRHEVDEFEWEYADKSEQIKSWATATKKDGKPTGDGAAAEVWASRVGAARLWPDHPYGKWWDPATYEAAQTWDLASMKAWIARKYQPSNADLIVVGKMDLDATEAAVRNYFSGWAPLPGAGAPPPAALPLETALPERQVLIFDQSIATQSHVSMQCHIKPMTTETAASRQVLGSVLSEEIWRRLREEAGITYGAYAYASVLPGGASNLTIGGLVQNDGTGFAVRSMLDLVASVQKGAVTSEQTAKAGWSEGFGYVVGQTSTSQMLGRLMGNRGYGREWSYFDTWRTELSEVDATTMPALIEPCVGHEVITIVGPREYAEAQLKEAGIAYEVVDWEGLYTASLDAKELKSYLKAKEKEAKKAAKDAAAE